MLSSSTRILSLALVGCAAIWNPSAQAGPNGVMGGGLRQLVDAWELGDQRLQSHLAIHIKNPSGEPLVHVHLENGTTVAQVLPSLRAAGFRLTAVSEIDPSRFEGFLPLNDARNVATLSGIKSIRAVQKPRRNAGSVQSQAVALQKADLAQAAGVDGTGIRIGVLSDSFNACGNACNTDAAADIGSGDLPAAGVTVLSDLPVGSGSDEGRAILQLVHDIAPGSKLGFATASNGEIEFSNSIIALRKTFGADVIVDDVVYFDEPMYSDGLISQAVDKVFRDGAAYYSSAGNNGLEAYEATYSPISVEKAQRLVARGRSNVKLDQIPLAIRPQSVHIFGANDDDDSNGNISQHFSTARGNYISFQWDEPFFVGKVKTDFNIYIFDNQGNWMDPNSPAFPGFYTADDNTQTDEAFEFIYLPPFAGEIHGGANVSDYQIVIGNVNGGPAKHIKYVNANGLGVSQIQAAPSIFGHAAARGGQAVAATYYAIPSFPEDFSSPGPVTIYFDAKGNRLDSPQIRPVPQIAAADGVDTTFFGFDSDSNGLPNFFGTSAAAPNAAAVAALALQAAGGPGSVKPARLYGLLQSTATPITIPNDRGASAAKAGPLSFSAQGDWTRWANYFGLAMDRNSPYPVATVSLDLKNTALIWSANPNRFHLGDSTGVALANITRSVSADQKKLTLTFTSGIFSGGQAIRFGMSAFNPLQGTTQVDPDRFLGMTISATLVNGASFSSTVSASPMLANNHFTGAGLVNADAAVRVARQRSSDLLAK